MSVDIRVDIQQPIEVVFSFASDPANLPLYEKSIWEVKKMTEGPIRAGTTYQLSAHQLGLRMLAALVITVYEPNQHVSFEVTAGPFPVVTHYRLTALDGGTRVTGERIPHPRGLWKKMVPILAFPARRKFYTELNGLKDYLEKKV
jgi:ligand-binding SRPBCC domain-containing protein